MSKDPTTLLVHNSCVLPVSLGQPRKAGATYQLRLAPALYQDILDRIFGHTPLFHPDPSQLRFEQILGLDPDVVVPNYEWILESRQTPRVEPTQSPGCRICAPDPMDAVELA